jgi:hypothetical protein
VVAGVADIDAGGVGVNDGQLGHLGLGLDLLLRFGSQPFRLTLGAFLLLTAACLGMLSKLLLLPGLSALAPAAGGGRGMRRETGPLPRWQKGSQPPARESAQAQPSQRDQPRTETEVGGRLSPNEWAENAPQLNRTIGPSVNALTHHGYTEHHTGRWW